MTARPVVKWAGGKTRSVEAICARLPKQIETYYEPFVGGGAVFFALAAEGRFRRAVISDSNQELITAYRAIRDDVEGVIGAIRRLHPGNVTADRYYAIRRSNPTSANGTAARLIYLNKTCFNGLYRVNQSGRFNVPFGSYANPHVLDSENLRSVSAALQGVHIAAVDFSWWQRACKAGDAVYFDPPYLPASKTANFASYTPDGFGLEEQSRLMTLFAALSRRGVSVVLSQSDTFESRAICKDGEARTVNRLEVPRSISCAGKKRSPVGELLISA
jgi:DNA adenine methylase